jgi:SAM-dependent methyltransferase
VVSNNSKILGKPLPQPIETFLNEVRKHPSRASNTYYLHTYVGYFDRMATSLSEISRILKPGGKFLLVAQDSYYKEIHADLAAYLVALAEQRDFKLRSRHDFIVKANLGYLNSRSRRYNATPFRVESVLVMERK